MAVTADMDTLDTATVMAATDMTAMPTDTTIITIT